jgi:hypothetical protein
VLASTALTGFRAVIAGATFGPYDTILAASGLMFLTAGLALVAPMRPAGSGAQATAGPGMRARLPGWPGRASSKSGS